MVHSFSLLPLSQFAWPFQQSIWRGTFVMCFSPFWLKLWTYLKWRLVYQQSLGRSCIAKKIWQSFLIMITTIEFKQNVLQCINSVWLNAGPSLSFWTWALVSLAIHTRSCIGVFNSNLLILLTHSAILHGLLEIWVQAWALNHHLSSLGDPHVNLLELLCEVLW